MAAAATAGVRRGLNLQRATAVSQDHIRTRPMAAMIYTAGIQASMYRIHLPPTNEKGIIQAANMKITKETAGSRRRFQIFTSPTSRPARTGIGVLMTSNKR